MKFHSLASDYATDFIDVVYTSIYYATTLVNYLFVYCTNYLLV